MSILPKPLLATDDHGVVLGALDVYIFPPSPTVSQRLRLASRATSLRSVVPQHDRASVHGALPGGLVYRRPSAPTATHKPPPKVTFDMAAPPKLSIGRLQLRPLVLVVTLPSVPTATHMLPSYPMLAMSPPKLVFCADHVAPSSTLVDRPLLAPTATHFPLP